MRRISAFLLAVFLIMTTGCSGVKTNQAENDSINYYKDIPGVTDEEISAIEKLKSERDSFSVGHLIEMEALLLPDGTYAGFTNDGCILLTELFGIEFKQVVYDKWQQMKSELDNHVLDFTDDFTPTSDKRGMYYMSEPVADRMQQIIRLVDTDIETEEDVNGLKLGFLDNSANVEPILRRYPELSFEVIPVDYISSIEKMLYSGEINAFVTDRNLDAFIDNDVHVQSKNFFPLAYTSVSIVSANPELEPVISVLNKYLDAGGTKKLYDLYKKYDFQYVKHRMWYVFTAEEKEYLRNLPTRGNIVYVALENDNYPYSFYNETEKQFQGMAVDILSEISRLTDIEFVNITSPTAGWAEILDALMTKKASIISQLGYTKERAEHFIWSGTPFSASNFVLISKDDYPKSEIYQINRSRVGVTDNTIYKDVYEEWFPDSNNLVLYPSVNETLTALEKGEIDLVMGAENILLTQANYREKTGYYINYRFNTKMDAMFGFQKDDTILRSIVDKTQQQIDVESIEGYWKTKAFDYSKVITEMQNRYLMLFTFALLLAFVVFVVLIWRNERLKRSLMEHASTIATIYSSIPDLICSKDLNGVFTSCNESFEVYAGFKEAELIGKTYSQIIKNHDPNTIEHIMQADKQVMARALPVMIEETVVYPDNTKRILEILKVPLLQNGKPTGMLGIGRDVTERKDAESRLELIINTAQIAFILTADGIVVEANEYGQKHIGVKIGDDMREFYFEPGQRDEIVKMAEEQGTASNIIVRFKMANGGIHRFLASFTYTEYEHKKSYIFWAIDIEQDKERDERLFAAQQSFQSVLDALPMPVRVVDLDTSNIVYVNDSLVELLKYDSTDEICGSGMKITDLLPHKLSDGTKSSERVDLMMSTPEPISVEIEYLTKSGEIIEAMVVSRQIEYMGRPSSIGIIKDLSTEKERERILKEAAAREKEANQTKTLFLANMSHEIRTPMNGVIGMTDLLLGEQLSGRQLQYVKDIKVSAESLLGIINDILDLSKITEGRLKITPVDADLSILLENTVSMMNFSASSKGLKFIDDIRINAPEYVRVDDVRLKQVIVNLLSNAIKFTHDGYVKLSVRIENGKILIEVKDTGIGIKNDELPLIFTAFEQADLKKNRAIKGTGLGLPISKNLVELMGGSITAESEYGKGSRFFVTIPYVQGDGSAVEAVDMVFEYISAPKAQVLLVDDIQANLTVGAGLLRHCNITADVALSGSEAIELIKAKDYDVVFMDHMMPEMDGIEATALIRDMGGKYGELPIVALTANAVNESRELLLSSGMNDFLSKPIDRGELMRVLMKWLPADKVLVKKEIDDIQDAPYSELLEEASKVDGLDIAQALGRISGLQDVLEESIRQVAFSLPERLKRMDASLAAGDLRSFGIDAHGLKGALSNIGAMRDAELATTLEIAAKAEDMSQCVEKFTVFAEIADSLAETLKSLFKQQELDSKQSGEIRFLTLKAEEAIEFLNNFEAEDALKCLNELNVFTFGEEADVALNDAKSLIKGYKYKKARLILNSIKTGG